MPGRVFCVIADPRSCQTSSKRCALGRAPDSGTSTVLRGTASVRGPCAPRSESTEADAVGQAWLRAVEVMAGGTWAPLLPSRARNWQREGGVAHPSDRCGGRRGGQPQNPLTFSVGGSRGMHVTRRKQPGLPATRALRTPPDSCSSIPTPPRRESVAPSVQCSFAARRGRSPTGPSASSRARPGGRLPGSHRSRVRTWSHHEPE